MTYRGHVKNGQITLDESAQLPEGAKVNVEVQEPGSRITHPRVRIKPRKFNPIHMPGPSLADELVQDRR